VWRSGFFFATVIKILAGMRARGRTWSTAPHAIASFGIPKTTQLASS
jgi:hypothetical protein